MSDIGLCQWVIDATQKMPRWWCQQMACIMCISSTFMVYFDDSWWMYVLDGLLMATSAVDLFASQSDFFIKFMGEGTSKGFRITQWTIAAIDLISLTPRGASGSLFFAASGAFMAFAACNPPAPPKPRGQLAGLKG